MNARLSICAVRVVLFFFLCFPLGVSAVITSNRPPVAVNDTATVSNGINRAISVLANDYDPDGDPISIFSFTQPLHGSVSQSVTQLVYQSFAGYCGSDNFSYTITDGRGGFSSNAFVFVTVTCGASNQNPVAVADFATVSSGSNVTISVLANDYDPNGDPLSISSFTQPLHGSVFQSGTQLVYQSASPYCGPDLFTYTIGDGRGGFASTNVSVTVNCAPSNHPPVAVNDSATVASGVSTFINVLANDYDPDFDPISIWSFGQPLHGSVFQAGGLYYQSFSGYAGPDSFSYTITDNKGGYSNALVSITVTNPPASADVSMTKYSSAGGPVTVGDQITYTLYAYNAGPSTSSNVVVRDAIPTGTVFVTATGGSCTFYPNFQRVDCSVGDLLPGNTAYVYVTVQVTNTGSIVNCANAYGSTADPDTSNNANCVTNTALSANADVSMTKSSSASGPVAVGDQITYTLYAYNAGPSISSNVVVRDAIPTGTIFVSASGGACTFYPNFQRVDCDVGDLPAFSSAYVYVTVQVTNAGQIGDDPCSERCHRSEHEQ